MIQRGRSYLESGESKKANNQFKAASRTLGAFLNALETFSKGNGSTSGLFKSIQRGARLLTESTIEHLALAQEA